MCKTKEAGVHIEAKLTSVILAGDSPVETTQENILEHELNRETHAYRRTHTFTRPSISTTAHSDCLWKRLALNTDKKT